MALLSVGQLVDRTAPPTEDQVALWQRRVRLWTDAGILPTVGPHDGTRRHRRYSDSVVYLAAVLLRMSDFVTDTSILRRLSVSIQDWSKGRGKFARLWRDAIKGIRPTCYISFSLKADYYPEISVDYDTNEYGLGAFTLYDEPAIFLNLSAIFAEVQRAAEE